MNIIHSLRCDFFRFLTGSYRASSSRSSAQRNPVYEYHKEASKSFERMQEYVNKLIVQNIMLSVIEIGADGKKDIYFA